MSILITGGAGFIGSNFILDWLALSDEFIINFDKLTYAGNQINLDSLKEDARYLFVQGDIKDSDLVLHLLIKYQVKAVIHFAAESHVDRSINGPGEFIQTNIVGTFRLLEAVKQYWLHLNEANKQSFRFHHISTDEVFGSLNIDSPPFTENTHYQPNSPYSASKASADHLVRAYHRTYGLPVITTHCSNNYGPYQFPEKLIPLCIYNALLDKPITIYGSGEQVRDWLYVKDHCSAIRCILDQGRIGEVYNIGGCNEKTNFEVVSLICSILDQEKPREDSHSYSEQIMYVKDRPGHDYRYAIDASKIEKDLGWKPKETFESGLKNTIRWYLNNLKWMSSVTAAPALNEMFT